MCPECHRDGPFWQDVIDKYNEGVAMQCVECKQPITHLLDRQYINNQYWHAWCREAWNAKEIKRLKIQSQRRQDLIVKLIEGIKCGKYED
jgi:hypothetical protein